MYGYNHHWQREMASDRFIQRFVPGGLNGSLGNFLDNMIGGNPNPTYGQMARMHHYYGGHGHYPHYGRPYGYHY